MSKIQIGRRSTKADEFIEGISAFMNAEGNFVASEFIETNTPNISKLYKTDKHFETFEIIENTDPVYEPVSMSISRYDSSLWADDGIYPDLYYGLFNPTNQNDPDWTGTVSYPILSTVRINGERPLIFSDEETAISELRNNPAYANIPDGQAIVIGGEEAVRPEQVYVAWVYNPDAEESADSTVSLTFNLTDPTYYDVGLNETNGEWGIHSMVLPEGITKVGCSISGEAGDGWWRVNQDETTLVLPSTVRAVSYQLFEQMNVNRVNIYATTPPTIGEPEGECKNFRIENVYGNYPITVHVPSGSEGAYRSAPGWSDHWACYQVYTGQREPDSGECDVLGTCDGSCITVDKGAINIVGDL